MRALNADAFDNPLERVLHERKAAEGMWAIQKIHLRSGQFYYRFVDADATPAPRWGEGAWWVDYENFRRIVALAERGEQSLGYAARLLLALPYSFRPAQSNAVNGVVRALLSQPLDALAGRGRMIEDRAARANRDAMAPASPGDAVICAETRPDGRHARSGPGGVSDHRVPPDRKRFFRMKPQRSSPERDHE